MNPQHDSPVVPSGDQDDCCPACGQGSVETVEIQRTFPYGAGEQAVELSAVVPLRRCRECGFEFLDAVAEERQHAAVCRHLGLMTPSEIRAVRQSLGDVSRSEFARITRLGEATVGRWERGELIQNAANDQLLYLLTFPENVARLRDRVERRAAPDCRPQSPVSG